MALIHTAVTNLLNAHKGLRKEIEKTPRGFLRDHLRATKLDVAKVMAGMTYAMRVTGTAQSDPEVARKLRDGDINSAHITYRLTR